MHRLRMLCLLVATAAVLVAGAAPATAGSVRGLNADAARPPAALDAMVLRPLGMLATVGGSFVFVLTSPIYLVTRPQEIDEPFMALVGRPAVWTWGRPLGGL